MTELETTGPIGTSTFHYEWRLEGTRPQSWLPNVVGDAEYRKPTPEDIDLAQFEKFFLAFQYWVVMIGYLCKSPWGIENAKRTNVFYDIDDLIEPVTLRYNEANTWYVQLENVTLYGFLDFSIVGYDLKPNISIRKGGPNGNTENRDVVYNFWLEVLFPRLKGYAYYKILDKNMENLVKEDGAFWFYLHEVYIHVEVTIKEFDRKLHKEKNNSKYGVPQFKIEYEFRKLEVTHSSFPEFSTRYWDMVFTPEVIRKMFKDYVGQKINDDHAEIISRFVDAYSRKVAPAVVKSESAMDVMDALYQGLTKKQVQPTKPDTFEKQMKSIIYFSILDEKLRDYIYALSKNLGPNGKPLTAFNKRSKEFPLVAKLKKTFSTIDSMKTKRLNRNRLRYYLNLENGIK